MFSLPQFLNSRFLHPYDTLGSTRYVDFDATRPVYATKADKCHISHVVADTDPWDAKNTIRTSLQ